MLPQAAAARSLLAGVSPIEDVPICNACDCDLCQICAEAAFWDFVGDVERGVKRKREETCDVASINATESVGSLDLVADVLQSYL